MTVTAIQKGLLRAIGVAGTMLFGFFFILTYHVPDWVERYAAGYIESEVAKRIDSSIDGLAIEAGESALSRAAASIFDMNAARIERLKSQLKNQVHERMADSLAEIRNLDCECRQKWANFLRDGIETEIGLLQVANDQVRDLIHGRYMYVLAELKRDIRIFTGTNASVFLFLLLVSLLKPRAVVHLFLPGMLLVVATLACSYLYVFEQNWLLTIINSDYLGLAYMAYLALAFSFLCDIVFNHGRVTTGIINAILNAIGSALSVVTC